jgi:hypothetical protein
VWTKILNVHFVDSRSTGYRWLALGDNDSGDYRDQIIQEQVNTSLVCALLLTIGTSGMFAIPSLTDDATMNIVVTAYASSIILSSGLLLVGVIAAVCIMLAVNECANEAEVKLLIAAIGGRERVGYLCWQFGTLIFGAVSSPIYVYIALNSSVQFALIGIVPGIGVASMLLFWHTGGVVQGLYSAKSGVEGTLVLSVPEIVAQISKYAATASEEYADADAFRKFLLKTGDAHKMSPLTTQRADIVFEAWYNRILRIEKTKLPSEWLLPNSSE